MRNTPLTCITLLLLFIHVLDLHAIVSYDKGRLEINGIQLFQDSKNEKAYYYLPDYPKLSISHKGNYEFLCIKYVGDNIDESGGLFHALINYKLSSSALDELGRLLEEKVPGAVLMGPVSIQEDPENENPSFRIISSILNNQDTFLQSKVISSGKAPFLPGSKVAISSLLNTKAATLLWSTFESKTSDVSVVVEGFFPALVSGFSATVSANLEEVYDHFSSFQSNGEIDKDDKNEIIKGFEKAQVFKALDSLSKAGIIKIKVADASLAYNVDNSLYKNLLDIITNKVTAMMFNTKDGWSQTVNTEGSDLLEDDDKNKEERPAETGISHAYYPRNLLALKSKKSIRSFDFKVTIDQSTAIKVPVYSAGNLGGFYNSYSEDENYFKVVDMDDPAFQSRDLHFQVNSSHSDCFKNGFDHASILIKKIYKDTTTNTFSETLRFNAAQIDSGELIQKCEYKRMDEKDGDWLNYKYKVAWYLDDIDTTLTSEWIESDLSSVSIKPPLQRRNITIDLDRSMLNEYGIQSARIRFGIKIAGQPQMTKMKVLRKTDTLSTDEIVVYHDKGEPIVYQINWYAKGKEIVDEVKLLDDDYLFLIPQDYNK